jgi:protein-tyrosine-phosphatase
VKWITRERARVDRIACPWLITRFVDPAPELLFVPAGDVMAVAAREQATPFDVPDVELGHHGPRCSFDAFLDRYDLDDPALVALAEIVRGADTDHRDLTPESAGLYAAATGFQAISRDDHDNMARQFPLYDALYDFCRTRTGAPSTKRVLFVCLHGAAKSVVAAAHFRALAAAQELPFAAVAAGTVPDPELTPAAVKGLAADGLIPAPAHPRPVTLHDLRTAARIVSFGCDVAAPGGQRVERWDDVPAVSEGYEGARARIVERLQRLVGDLSGRQG